MVDESFGGDQPKIIVPPPPPPPVVEPSSTPKPALKGDDWRSPPSQDLEKTKSLNKWLVFWIALIAGGICIEIIVTATAYLSNPETSTTEELVALKQVDLHPLTEELFNSFITEGQAQFNRGEYQEAIESLYIIPAQTIAYSSAQDLKKRWSTEWWQQASKAYNDGKIENAIEMAEEIVPEAAEYEAVQTQLEQWRREQVILNAAEVALENEQWQEALAKVEELKNSPIYQSSRIQETLNKIREHLNPPRVTTNPSTTRGSSSGTRTSNPPRQTRPSNPPPSGIYTPPALGTN